MGISLDYAIRLVGHDDITSDDDLLNALEIHSTAGEEMEQSVGGWTAYILRNGKRIGRIEIDLSQFGNFIRGEGTGWESIIMSQISIRRSPSEQLKNIQ